MVSRHCAAWLTERQERLTSLLKEAFSEKPTTALVCHFYQEVRFDLGLIRKE